jgi:hypothetical protein
MVGVQVYWNNFRIAHDLGVHVAIGPVGTTQRGFS